ncbi:MAG: MarR family transcriptional regulator [Anaerocolumna sp.]|jgi:DNA-binding MarR family transcriptional regulator|nr:MarR family transcriptional regulator [Anaerocolumna sp.]
MENIGKLNAAIYRNLQSILNYKLEGISIQSGQYDFFYVISLNEGITQKELCEWLYIGKSTTAKVIKNLVLNEYIYKEKDSVDKRFERLYLTDKGRQIAERIHETFLETVMITTKGLTEEEIDLTIGLLKKILSNVTEVKNEINKNEVSAD